MVMSTSPSIGSQLAYFGGQPAVPKGRIVHWPAACNEHLAAIERVLAENRYHRVNHPMIGALENVMGKWSQGFLCRAVATGTAALHIGLDYYAEPGAHVVVSPLTWPGVLGAIFTAGMVPSYVDVDPATGDFCETGAAGALSGQVRGVVITHLFGRYARHDALRTCASLRGLFLIDDCAQAIGAVPLLRKEPTDVVACSGNGAKHLGAGELGLLFSMHRELIEHVDRVSLVSSNRDGTRILAAETRGFNYRPNVFSAAVALTRFEGLSEQIARRRANRDYLIRELSDLPGLHFWEGTHEETHSCLSVPARIEASGLGMDADIPVRDAILALLAAEGVPVDVWLRKPAWAYLREEYRPDHVLTVDFPGADRLLSTMFHIGEIAPPNDKSVMSMYVYAFHKVWRHLPHLKKWLETSRSEVSVR